MSWKGRRLPTKEDRTGAEGKRKKPDKPEPPSAINTAIRLLARREHSRHELKKKLLERDIEPDKADEAIAKMLEHDLQSDDRFVRASISMKAGAGHGPRRIRAELNQHQLDEGQIEEAMGEADIDWTANARDIVVRRYGSGKLEFKLRNKAMNFLLRRGFSMDDARAAVDPNHESFNED